MYIDIVGPVTHHLIHLASLSVWRCILTLMGLSHIAYFLMANNHSRIFILLFMVGPVLEGVYYHCWDCHTLPIFPLPDCVCPKMYANIVGPVKHCPFHLACLSAWRCILKHWWASHTLPILLWPIIMPEYLYWYSQLGLSHMTYSSLASLCISKGVYWHVYWYCWACHTSPFPPCQSECIKMFININEPVTHWLFPYGQ